MMNATTCIRYGSSALTLGSLLPRITVGFPNPNPSLYHINITLPATFSFGSCKIQSSPSSSSTQFHRCLTDSTTASSTLYNGAYEGVVRFPLSPSSTLVIQKGDITKWFVDGTTDAIVNPANESMLGGGNVHGAIHRAAGPDLLQACYQVPEVMHGVRCPPGEARITPGFLLPASHVIHTVGPIYNVDRTPAASLRNAYRKSLKFAKESNIQYVAFPAISCGGYGYPYDEAAILAFSTIREFPDDFKEVHFVLSSSDIYIVWLEKANNMLKNLPLNSQNPIFELKMNRACKSNYQIERGTGFETGESFYREESAISRDLGVLSASLYKKSNGQLRVLDALCGCGVRSLRYLVEAEADFVLANDCNESYRQTIIDNLSVVKNDPEGTDLKWIVTHLEANRIMSEYYLKRDYFDFIDVDSFGSDSSFLRSAMNALKLGGLLYVTSTDGFSSGGHRPHRSLAAYGAYVRPLPYSNEIGLRMLIGGAVREASVLGYHVTPLFSYYSCHAPVFRVLLRLNKGDMPNSSHYGFIGYCRECGNSIGISWDKLGQITCSCADSMVPSSLSVSGPLWLGPLHETAYLKDITSLGKQLGWVGNNDKNDLEKLLERMLDESQPELPFGYIKMDEVASRAKINSPSLKNLMNAIQEEGYFASRSHIANNAFKTNCPMTECIRIAKGLRNCPRIC